MRRAGAVATFAVINFLFSSPAGAQDPPLEDARVEGSFAASGPGSAQLRDVAPTCPTGPCGLTGEARIVEPDAELLGLLPLPKEAAPANGMTVPEQPHREGTSGSFATSFGRVVSVSILTSGQPSNIEPAILPPLES